jgi:hypothetical protein
MRPKHVLLTALLGILWGLATGCRVLHPPTTEKQLTEYEAKYRAYLKRHPEVTPVELP